MKHIQTHIQFEQSLFNTMTSAMTVVGAGYVGLSMAALLSRKYPVRLLDIDSKRVEMINHHRSPLEEADLAQVIAHPEHPIEASTSAEAALRGARLVILAVPTNFDPQHRTFDTHALDQTIEQAITHGDEPLIVIKSTLPIGYTESARKRFNYPHILFSPEFLREGRALHDNLHPSRIVVGGRDARARSFAHLLQDCAETTDIPVLLTGSTEAEAIKLFANTCLAMRVAFFNELDTFCLHNRLEARDVINGISLDPRIGSHYNNPSFGYGGYCLPKDTRQLQTHFERTGTPEALVSAAIQSNETRKKVIARDILARNPARLGVYRLAMKAGSDNYRNSATIEVLQCIHQLAPTLPIRLYEPLLTDPHTLNIPTLEQVDTPEALAQSCDLIISNRMDPALRPWQHKVYTRDLFSED